MPTAGLVAEPITADDESLSCQFVQHASYVLAEIVSVVASPLWTNYARELEDRPTVTWSAFKYRKDGVLPEERIVRSQASRSSPCLRIKRTLIIPRRNNQRRKQCRHFNLLINQFQNLPICWS